MFIMSLITNLVPSHREMQMSLPLLRSKIHIHSGSWYNGTHAARIRFDAFEWADDYYDVVGLRLVRRFI